MVVMVAQFCAGFLIGTGFIMVSNTFFSGVVSGIVTLAVARFIERRAA